MENKDPAAEKALLLINAHKNIADNDGLKESPVTQKNQRSNYLNDDDFVSEEKPVAKEKKKRSFRGAPTPYLSLNIFLWILFIGVDVALGFIVYLFYPF